jgi:recombination protein RecT
MNGQNVATLNRPSISTVKPLAKVQTIAEALEHPELRERLSLAAPRHMNPERLLRVFHLALQKTPDLAKADLRELLGALIGFAAIGIEPNTPLGHGWLIPFAKRGKVDGQWVTIGMQIQPIIGYRGFIDLARRSGSLVSIHADVVYQGDNFSYEYGTDEHLRHRYGDRDGDVLHPLFAYACASVEGGHQFEVMPWRDVMRIRDGSQGYQSAKRAGGRTLEASPWVAHTAAMARKTPIRQLFKTLPTSIEQSVAVSLDEMSERRSPRFGALIDASPSEVSADTMDALVDYSEHETEQKPEAQQTEQREPEQAKAANRATATAKPKAKADPKPEPEAEAQAEPEEQKSAPEQAITLVWPDGSDTTYADEVEAAEALYMALMDAETLVDIDGLAKTANTLRPHLSKSALKGMGSAFAVAREGFKEVEPAEAEADSDDAAEAPKAEADAEPEAKAEAEPEAEADAEVAERDWSVDFDSCQMEGGKINTMKLQKLMDDASKQCLTADDWHDFIEQNGPALEALQAKLKTSHDKLMARYKKGTA